MAGRAMMKSTLKWSVVSVLFWTSVAVIFALPQLGQDLDLHRVFTSALAQWWSWGMMVPGILAVDRALPFPVQQILPRCITLFALGPFVSILYGYVHAIVKAALGAGAWSRLSGT